MFEKILDLFFKADEEEVEEEKEIVEEKTTEKEISMDDFKEIIVNEPKEVKEIVAVEKVEVKSKPSFDITADGPFEKDRTSKKKVRMARREEYDLQPVISPYFGVKGEVNSPVKKERKPVTSYRNEPKKNEYSEVISPIYGIKEKKVEIAKKEEPIFVKEKRVIEVPSFDMVEEEANIALDDILSSKDGSDDDMIQFSLFGDDKRIQDDVFRNEDMDDDSLPF